MSKDKDNELVLVVKTSTLFPEGVWEGFREIDGKTLTEIINKNGEYLKRSVAETDESYQQIIAQIVLKAGSKVFVHRIPQTGSESRLHDMWPIFLGGHINDTDSDISKAFEREFSEEIKYKGKILSKTFWGVVKLHDNPVNKVHVGLVNIFEGDSEEFEATGDNGLLDGRFVDISGLNKYLDKMSYWSQAVTPYLIRKFV